MMISGLSPYLLFQKVYNRFTSCHEKEHLKNIYFITIFCKKEIGRDRMKSGALILMVLTLVIAFSVHSAVAQEHFEHALGHFETLSTTQGIIIAAPHGTYDIRTDALAKDVARLLGAGYVIARGFSSGASRINVNRPTEGAGSSCEREQRTERARDVYDHYIRLVDKSCKGKTPQLYVEIHGHTSLAFLNRLEIATTGITMEEARTIKKQLPAFLAQAKKSYSSYPELELRIEPLDKVYFGARCDKTIGYISTRHMDRALHIEVPRSARAPKTIKITAALIGSIARAVMNSTRPVPGPGGKEEKRS